jgi:hypothetical protein
VLYNCATEILASFNPAQSTDPKLATGTIITNHISNPHLNAVKLALTICQYAPLFPNNDR